MHFLFSTGNNHYHLPGLSSGTQLFSQYAETKLIFGLLVLTLTSIYLIVKTRKTWPKLLQASYFPQNRTQSQSRLIMNTISKKLSLCYTIYNLCKSISIGTYTFTFNFYIHKRALSIKFLFKNSDPIKRISIEFNTSSFLLSYIDRLIGIEVKED